MSKVVLEFPPFDTGRFEAATFLLRNNNGELTVDVEGRDPIIVEFSQVRWHQFTAMYNCTPEQIEAYFEVVEVTPSDVLTDYLESDLASVKAYSALHHYRIYLDEHGCHEVFAESFSAA